MKLKHLLIFLLATQTLFAQSNQFSENFEQTSNSKLLPTGWDGTNDCVVGTSGKNNNYLWRSTALTRTTNHENANGRCAVLAANNNYTIKSRLKTPVIALSTTKYAKIKFKLRNATAAGSLGDFSLYVSTDSGATYLTNPVVQHVSTGNVWTDYEYSLAPYLGQNIVLVFEGASSGASSLTYYYFLDNIEITDAPSCQNPTSLIIYSLTHRSATLTWALDPQYGSVPTAYSLQLKDNNNTLIYDTTGYATLDNTFNFTNLTPSTTYTARVMSDCSTAHKGTSEWQEVTFTTPTAPATLPMIVNFDTLNALPGGSYSQNASLFTASASTTALVYGGSGKSLRLSTTTSDNAYFILPSVDVAANNMEVDFKIKTNTGTDPVHFKAGYVYDLSDIVGTFYPVVMDSLENGADWRSIFFNAVATGDTTNPISFCIAADAGSATYIYVDEIDIHQLPSCRRPEGLTAYNPTSSSVTLSWSYASSSMVEFTAVAADGTTVKDTASATPYILNGLTANTQYTITARTLCGTDSSRITPAIAIRTQCQSIAASTLSESFEGIPVYTAPDCWRMEWLTKPSGTTLVAPFTATSQNSHSGQKCFSFLAQESGAVSYLSSPLLTFPQAGANDISLWFYRKNIMGHTNERVEIWATPLENSTAGGTLLGTCYSHYEFGEAETSTGWYGYQYNIPLQGNYHITLVCYGEGGSMEFDDVEIVPAPACRNVRQLRRGSIGVNDITLLWTPITGENNAIVEYRLYQHISSDTATLIRDTVVTVASPSIQIANLAPATYYDIEATVRTLCASGDSASGVQISLQGIQTRCEPVVTFPYMTGFETTDQNGTGANPLPQCWSRLTDGESDNVYPYNYLSTAYARNGSQSLYFHTHVASSTSTYPNYEVAVMPAIDTTVYPVNQLKIRFSAKRVGTESAAHPLLHVGVLTDPEDVTTFTLVQDVTISGATYADYTVLMNNYTGTGIYPAMMLNAGTAEFSFVVDDVTIEHNNNCNDIVSGLTVHNVKCNSVGIRIIDNTVDEWQVSCCTTGVMPDNGTIVNVTAGLVATVYGLTAETYYTAYVRRICGTEVSSWSVGESFRTKCPSIATYPFTEDFESQEIGLLGGCYDVTSTSSGELKVMQQSATAVMGEIYNHTPNGARGLMCSDPSSPGQYYPMSGVFTISRIFHMKPGKQYSVSLWAKQFEYYSNYTWKFTVKYGLAPESLVPVQTFTVSNKTFQQFETLFSVNTEDDYYITIETTAGDNNNQYYPQIDDIVVDEFSCAAAGNLIVHSVKQDSVTLSYSASGQLWQVAVATDTTTAAGGGFANPLFIDTCVQSNITIGNLQPNTDYYCIARNICNAGDTSKWSNQELFHTKCLSKSLPSSDSFERDDELSCWSSIVSGTVNSTFERSNAYRVAGYSSLKIANCIAVSPEYYVDSLTNCFIRGWVMAESNNANVLVMLMSDPDDVSTASDPVATIAVPEKNKWYEFVIYFDTISKPGFYGDLNSRFVAFYPGTATIYMDSIVVEPVGACPMPYGAEISNVGANSFDISFTAKGSATEWIVYTNGVPNTITTNPATITDLASATEYKVTLASSCSSSSTSYTFDCGSIRTECGIFNLPWSTSFEQNENYTSLSYRQGELEEKCWLTYGVKPNNASYPYYYMSTEYSVSGRQSLDLYNGNSGTTSMFIVLPQFAASSRNLRWKFHYRNSATSAPVVQMGYLTNATDTSSFVLVRTLPATTDWTVAELLTSTLPAIPANARLALRHIRLTSGGTVYIDDMNVSQPLTCPDPEMPSVIAFSHNSATIAITDTCATHNHWQYCVGEIGDDVTTLSVANTYTDTFDITGLTSATDYYVYIRAVCGAGDYSNWTRCSFTTECEPVHLVAGIPFVDSFEDQQSQMPLSGCYTFSGFQNNTNCVRGYSNPSGYDNVRSGNICLYSQANRSYTPDGQTIYRKFYLEKGKVYKAGVYVYTRSHAADISVMFGTDSTDMTVIDAATIDQHQAVNNSYRQFWQYVGNYFVPDSTAVYYIAFQGLYNGANTSMIICYDDFTVEEVAGCVPPVATILTTTGTSVTALLSDTASTSSFQYKVSLNGEEILPVTALNAPLFTIDTLNPSTTYTLEVRRNCGSDNYSEWYQTDFSTECAAISSFPFTEDFEGTFPPLCWTITAPDTATWVRYSSASTGYTSSGVGSAHMSSNAIGEYALLSTPEMQFNGQRDYTLSFYCYRSTSATNKDETEVYLSPSPTSVDNAILLGIAKVAGAAQSGMSALSYEIPEGTNGRYYIVFKGKENMASYATYCYIDDVVVEQLPECNPLNGISIVGTTSTTITVSAPLSSDHSAVRFTCAAGGNTITSPDCSGIYTFTGLTSDTEYELAAYAVCGPQSFSGVTASINARTTTTDCFAPAYLRTLGIVADDDVVVTWYNSPMSTATYYRLTSNNILVRQGVCSGDTMTLSGLTASTSYTFSVSNYCSGDTTAWSSINFATSAYTFDIPFYCGFEDGVQNSHWQTHNFSGPNSFIFGMSTAAVNAGSKALYVTNDGGSYNYTSSVNTGYGADAEALITMPAGFYNIQYDWKCGGVVADNGYIRDYGRLFLVPASTTIANVATYTYNSTTLGGNIIQTDTRPLVSSNSWVHNDATIEIPEDGIYRMVVVFANDDKSGSQPPLAIDNISIEKIECMFVKSTSVVAVTTNSASVAVRKREASKPLQYGFSRYADVDSVAEWHTSDNGYKNDTVTFDSLNANTIYYLFTRHLCDTANWSKALCDTVRTPAVVYNTPFVCSFEADEPCLESWMVTTGTSVNAFVMGNATATEGSRSLYVSNDGYSYNYSVATDTSASYAYIPLNFPAGSYEIIYDWRGEGEEGNDFARLFLAPVSMIFDDGNIPSGLSATSLPIGCISLDGGEALCRNSAWQKASYASFNVTNDNVYYLVAYWHNDAANGTQPPFAIDNITVRPITCPRPQLSDITAYSIDPHTATIHVAGGATSSLRYLVSSNNQYSDTVAAGLLAEGDSLVTFTGLASSSLYYIALRYLCSASDSSAILSCKVRTACEAVTQFPYIEGFEEVDVVSNSQTYDVLADLCWMVESPTLNTYYSISMNASQTYAGSRSLYVNNGNTGSRSQILALPLVDTLDGKVLSLYYKNANLGSRVILMAGYLTDPDDASTFVTLYTASLSTDYTSITLFYSNIPAGSRAALMASGNGAICIDQVRLNNYVVAPQEYATVCNNTGYYNRGFNCPASSLYPGDTTLTRLAQSTVMGIADSIITVNLHILNAITHNTSDTICAGDDYIKGDWHLVKPSAGVYFDTYTSAGGCDSTVNLVLTVIPTRETHYDTICQGDAYQFYGQTLTTPGIYTGYTINPFGCNDTITLYLAVIDSLHTTTATICQGSSYQFEGNTYTQSGTYYVLRTGAHGCPLIKRLCLAVVPTDSTINVALCHGGSVIVVDTLITTAGTYELRRVGTAGCTMTYHINATVKPLIAVDVYDDVCEGYPYYGHGISGLYITQDTVVVVNTRTYDLSCDSSVNVHITLLPTQYSDTVATIPQGGNITWHDETYTKAGDYTVRLYDIHGCDSIVTLHLSVGSGVEEVEMFDITLYPNPAKSGEPINISLDGATSITFVDILTSTGEIVDCSFSIVNSQLSIVNSQLPPGIYFVRITTDGNKVYVRKLIVR